MVYKFRLLSDEVKDFVRDIEIRSDQTFFDFHRIIQDDLGYDNSQIASFFLTNSLWEKEKEFTLFDMSDGENKSLVPMDKAFLKNYILDPKQRLIYVFDFFNERTFFIELTDTQKEIKYSDYPAVTFSKGNPPQQILFGNNNIGVFSDFDNQNMDFNEDYAAETVAGFETELGEDFDEDLPEGFNEDNQDAEPEE
jgi:hypothetical protein